MHTCAVAGMLAKNRLHLIDQVFRELVIELMDSIGRLIRMVIGLGRHGDDGCNEIKLGTRRSNNLRVILVSNLDLSVEVAEGGYFKSVSNPSQTQPHWDGLIEQSKDIFLIGCPWVWPLILMAVHRSSQHGLIQNTAWTG